jgi:energy-coupling factor transporter ATP-binding protein EcfA2
MTENPTKLGTVEDVNGPTVSINLDEKTDSGLIFIDGKSYKIGQVGSFVRLPQGYKDLFGIVSQVGASAIPESKVESEKELGERWMTVQLIGEGTRKGLFERGLTQYPAIGDPVHLVTEDDLEKIYGRPESSQFLKVGTISTSETIPALVDINKLITRHSAVLGNTGAGKSTTVTSLLRSIIDSDELESARCVVLDIHGEYASAFKDEASVFRVRPEKDDEEELYIPYWALNFEELVKITFGELDDKKSHKVLEEILEKKRETLKNHNYEVEEDEITADSPIPFSIHQLWFELHKKVLSTHTQTANQSLDTVAFQTNDDGQIIQEGDPMSVIPPLTKQQDGQNVFLSQSRLNIRRGIESLASKLRDERLDFLFRPGDWTPDTNGEVDKDLDELLENWIGSENSISILDLSGVPSDILETLIGALLRIIYDSMFWAKNLSEGARERPILFVLEEAHSYLGKDGNSSATKASQRIVKEGRKYGMGAMIVSQRPSEVDPTILSQCGTFFALRLSNRQDQSNVTSIAPDNLQGLFSMLPILKTGEVIISGESVKLPIRCEITLPNPEDRPDSEDPVIYEYGNPSDWEREKEPTDYSEVVTLWRKQRHEPESLIDLDNKE